MNSAFGVNIFLFPFPFHNVKSPNSRQILFTSVKKSLHAEIMSSIL